MEIVDGFRNFGASLNVVAKHGHIARLAQRVGVTVPDLSELDDSLALEARIYRNQWIVECPDCRNAEYVFLETPIFMCSTCFNGSVAGRKWRRIALPKERMAIEAALKARALPASRNWNPGESVADLARENAEHGVAQQEM